MADKESHIYTAADIDRYLNGDMTAKEMHNLERAALGDLFLADAIEGYQHADKQQTARHLNQISAAIHNQKPAAKVIQMRVKKIYSWQIAVAAIFMAALGIFLFYKRPDNEVIALAGKQKSIIKNDTNAGLIRIQPSVADSLLATAKPVESDLASKKNTTVRRKKKAETPGAITYKSDNKEPITAAASPQATTIPQANNPDTTDNEIAMARVSGYQSRLASPPAKVFVLDKEKQFVLSQVEEINLGKKKTKIIDTASIKPEGGWQSFHNYLTAKLAAKDTAAFKNNTPFESRIELEFSFGESGLPYDIKVLQPEDSTAAKRAANAIQNGPNWISKDKKKKRIHLSY